jgi:putative acetyltransferase
MNVRDATPTDAEAVRTVHYASIVGLGPDAYDRQQVEAWASGCGSADYTAIIESDAQDIVVADRDGVVVGFGSLRREQPDDYRATVDAELTAVYVLPSVAREGVGTAIYETLEQRARDREVTSLGLSASLPAVPFYEAHGYERVREFSHEFSPHVETGVTGRIVEMRKQLL